MDVVMLISWSHYYNRRGMFMIEKLEEYGRFLFGWAFRAMQSEMTMQESLNAKSERAYLTGTEIALLEDSSLFIIGIGILVLMEAFFVVVVISLLLHGVMELIIRCLVDARCASVPLLWMVLLSYKGKEIPAACSGQEDPEAPGSASFTIRSGV